MPGPPGGRIGLRYATLVLALACSSASAVDYPKRRTGLWEVRSVGTQAAGMPATLHCVGDRTDTEAHHLDRTAGQKGACSLGRFRRFGSAWVADSVCREGRTVVTSRKIATGNFLLNYRIDTVVRYEPPLAGTRREDKDALEARYLGPCGPGQRPGDMIVPGMGTLNMSDGTFRPDSAARGQTR